MMFLNAVLAEPTKFTYFFDIFKSSIGPLIEGAIVYTIPLSIISFIFGIILALLTALAKLSQSKILRIIASIYVSIMRGTPLLVQLFIIFYGLASINIIIDPFPAAIIGFSLNVGAYASETIRGAILAVARGQWEAGYAVGMTKGQVIWRIILPQATKIAVPPLSNSFIGLVKDTSLAAMILVAEMFRRAQEIAATNYEILFVYTLAAAVYWIICFVLTIGQNILEKRLNQQAPNSIPN